MAEGNGAKASKSRARRASLTAEESNIPRVSPRGESNLPRVLRRGEEKRAPESE